MSIPEPPQRPAFHALNESTEFDRLPFSRLAYVAFATGLLSLFAAFSIILLPLAMLSLGLGVAVMWKLSRDQYMAGRWLAQIGLALSAAAIVWSISARTGTDQYMYSEAGQHAKLFLDMLSSGRTYEALELKKAEVSRQLTGTNLKDYYDGLSEDQRRGVDEFLKSEVTKAVMAAGPQADWQFEQGVGVSSHESQTFVIVDMVNRAAQGNTQVVRVKMLRQTEMMSDPEKFDSTALWSFEDISRP